MQILQIMQNKRRFENKFIADLSKMKITISVHPIILKKFAYI